LGNTFRNKIIGPYFYSCNGRVTDVNREFTDFTGFTKVELIGKSLEQIGTMLKINSQRLLDNISSVDSIYIFTKSLNAREVNISLFHDTETNGQVYSFVEKPNSRLDDKLIFIEQLIINNVTGFAVYSAPDLILLKCNQKYLELVNCPLNNLENSIGTPVSKIIDCFVGSESQVVWNSILETKKNCYIKDFRKGDVTFRNYTQTAILENGKIKYIFETASEISEMVFDNQSLLQKNKIIEQQKENLEQKTHILIV